MLAIFPRLVELRTQFLGLIFRLHYYRATGVEMATRYEPMIEYEFSAPISSQDSCRGCHQRLILAHARSPENNLGSNGRCSLKLRLTEAMSVGRGTSGGLLVYRECRRGIVASRPGAAGY